MENILLIGGGPSITLEILDRLNIYNNCIKFGCNMAYQYINNLDYLGFIDQTFYTNNIDNIIKEKSKQNFKIISQLNQKFIDLSFPLKFKNPKRTKERSNTGTYLLKYIFKRYNNSNIYLFGFDMCMPENRKNFHNDYNEKFTDQQKHGHVNGHYLYISRLIKENKTNNQIYSCSDISRLNELLEYKFPDGF